MYMNFKLFVSIRLAIVSIIVYSGGGSIALWNARYKLQ